MLDTVSQEIFTMAHDDGLRARQFGVDTVFPLVRVEGVRAVRARLVQGRNDGRAMSLFERFTRFTRDARRGVPTGVVDLRSRTRAAGRGRRRRCF